GVVGVVGAAGGAEDQEVLDLVPLVLGEHVAAGRVLDLGGAGDRLGLRRRRKADLCEWVVAHGSTCLVGAPRGWRMWVVPGAGSRMWGCPPAVQALYQLSYPGRWA